MGAAFVRNHTSGTDTATATLAANVSATNTLVVWVAFDNTGTSTPAVSSIDKPGGETASWAQIASHNSSTATSAAGCRGEMWAIRTTQQWNSGTVITVTLDASVARKVALCAEFSGTQTSLRGTAGSGTSTGGTPSATTAGTAPVNGDLVLGGGSFESNTAATDDTDTTNGSWSSGLKANTASGGSAANVSAIFQYKIVTAGGNQTFNPTESSDSGAAVVALIPAPLSFAVGTVTETDTALTVTGGATSRRPSRLTLPGSRRGGGIALAHNAQVRPSGGGTVAVGTVTETDSALPIGKARPVGLASETDSALAVSRVKSRTVGIAAETDTAQTIARAKTKAVSAATETDTALSVTLATTAVRLMRPVVSTIAVATAQAAWSRPAQLFIALTPVAVSPTTVAVGTATETDGARPIGKARPAGTATEADTAQAVARSKSRTVGVVSESNAAQTVGRRKAKSVPLASENDSAQAITARKTRLVAIAGETDLALSLQRSKSRTVATATETDTALAVARRKSRLLGIASASQQAVPIGFGGWNVLVGTATESDSARPVGKAKARALAVASEVDTALTIARRKTRPLGTATETDTARPMAGGRVKLITLTTETDSSWPVLRSKARLLAAAVEADLARVVLHAQRQQVAIAVETDLAVAVTVPATQGKIRPKPRDIQSIREITRATATIRAGAT